MRIRDVEALRSVRPSDVAYYLASRDWHRDVVGVVEWWVRGAGGAEIMLPTSQEYGDFPLRISQVLSALEREEARAQDEILRDINSVGIDVVRVRAPEADARLNSIGLKRVLRLVEHAMEVMAAIATSVLEPRKVIPSKRPYRTQEFMRQLEMGQTEAGSYVLTLLSPIEPAGQSVAQPLFDAGVPYPRRVTRMLAAALKVTTESLESASPPAAVLASAVPRGISANFCEAIAEMVGGEDGPTPIDLNIAWAPKMPEAQLATFHITSSHILPLREAAKRLRSESPNESVILKGMVTSLRRDDAQHQRAVTVVCLVDGKVRRLFVPLDTESYELAIEAHRLKRLVSFRADVQASGYRYRAANVAEFGLVPVE